MIKRVIIVGLLLVALAGCAQQAVQVASPSPTTQPTSPAPPSPTSLPPTSPPLTPSPTPLPAPQPTLEPAQPARRLDTVWGASGSDVFAAGEAGTILHYDGTTWSPMESGTPYDLANMWGSSGSDVFAIGEAGTILHYDGTAWSPMVQSHIGDLIGLWGSSSSDVFASGSGGTILRYDGQAWSTTKSPIYTWLVGLWGSSASDVFTAGFVGNILHYDGQAWSPMTSGTIEDLEGMWGTSGSNVFVAGTKGTILHYDGKVWSPVPSGTTSDFVTLWGSSASDIFVVGAAGTILHYDGQTWSPMTSGTTTNLNGVWGSSASDVFAVGEKGTILHYDGTAWSDMTSGALAAVSVSKTPTPQPAKPAAQAWAETRHEKITSQALAGNLLGDPAAREIYVTLPPGYAASDKRYPVVYVMPWGDGKPFENSWGFQTTMESLLGKDEINEMIVVVPDGSSKLGASLFRNSPTIGDYEIYVTQEVVDYVDTHYRTLPARDSRGLAGCSNGGSISMRLGLKYPHIFSLVAATDGSYDDSLEMWPADVEEVQRMKKLPENFSDLYRQDTMAWYIQAAAGSAPDPDNPPFYCEMPFRIVDGHGEFVPEVIAKIVENDAAHEARRYLEQPVRLRGIYMVHGVYDTDLSKSTASFEQLLTDLGVEHEYVEVNTAHCGPKWEEPLLKYMSDKLVFEE